MKKIIFNHSVNEKYEGLQDKIELNRLKKLQFYYFTGYNLTHISIYIYIDFNVFMALDSL